MREIRDHIHVGPVADCNLASILYSVIARGVYGHHSQRVDGRDACRDGYLQQMIEIPAVGNKGRSGPVGRQHDPAGCDFLTGDRLQQVRQVGPDRAVAQHRHEAGPQAISDVLRGHCFMTRGKSRSRQRGEALKRRPGGMSFHRFPLVPCRADLAGEIGIALQHVDPAGHFSHCRRRRQPPERPHRGEGETLARLSKGLRMEADQPAELHRQPGQLLQQAGEAIGSRQQHQR